MFAVYRIQIEEYQPGFGWVDDGYLYSTDQIKLKTEVERRLTSCYFNQERVRAGSSQIVVVHETFLRDLKTTPVLSTVKGMHPADLGPLKEYKEKVKHNRVPAAQFQHLSNTLG